MKGGRKWIRTGLVIASAFVALAGAELAHRAWSWSQGRPHDRARINGALWRAERGSTAFLRGDLQELPEEQLEEAGKFGHLNPFFGSEHHHDTGGVLRFFRDGVPKRAYVVLVVGGSVASYWSDDADGVFAELLAADARLEGRSVHVLRFAHPAFKAPQQVTRLAYLLSFGYRPDAVINLDGFNELALSADNARTGTNPIYPSMPVWGAVLRDRKDLSTEALDALVDYRDARNAVVDFARRAGSWRLTRSSLASRFIDARLQTLLARSTAAQASYVRAMSGGGTLPEQQQRQLQGPPYANRPSEVLRLCVASWYEGSLSLQGLCAMRGIYYLHCLQPALHDPDSKPPSAEEQAMADSQLHWKQSIEVGYPLLRERGAELARRGVRFEDVSRSFEDVTETLYTDPCHIGALGNRILSRAIAERFLQHMPDLPRPGR